MAGDSMASWLDKMGAALGVGGSEPSSGTSGETPSAPAAEDAAQSSTATTQPPEENTESPDDASAEPSWLNTLKEGVNDLLDAIPGAVDEESPTDEAEEETTQDSDSAASNSGEAEQDASGTQEEDGEEVIGGETATLTVQVEFSDERPASGAPVFCEGEGGQQVYANDRGHVSVPLPPGTYTVRSLWGASQAHSPGPITLAAGESRSVSLVLGDRATLQVQVNWAHNHGAVAGTTVQVSGRASGSAQTDGTGLAIISNLQPGSYLVAVGAGSGTSGQGATANVTLETGELTTVALKPIQEGKDKGTIIAEVTDSAGTPVSGVIVKATWGFAIPGSGPAGTTEPTSRTNRTNAEGKATLPAFAGVWTVETVGSKQDVTVQGGQSHSVQLTYQDNAETQAQFIANHLGELQGRADVLEKRMEKLKSQLNAALKRYKEEQDMANYDAIVATGILVLGAFPVTAPIGVAAGVLYAVARGNPGSAATHGTRKGAGVAYGREIKKLQQAGKQVSETAVNIGHAIRVGNSALGVYVMVTSHSEALDAADAKAEHSVSGILREMDGCLSSLKEVATASKRKMDEAARMLS